MSANTGIKALWILWVLALVLFPVLVIGAFFRESLAYLKLRRTLLAAPLSDLTRRFTALDQSRSSFVGPLLSVFYQNQLSKRLLSKARSELSPVWDLELLEHAQDDETKASRTSTPGLSLDPVMTALLDSRRTELTLRDTEGILIGRSEVPSWLLSRLPQADTSPSMVCVRSTPPSDRNPDRRGSRDGAGEPPPDSHLAYAARNDSGEVLLVKANLDYIFGKWLRLQWRQLNLSPDVTYEWVSATRPTESRVFPDPSEFETVSLFGALGFLRANRVWRVPAETFLAGESPPFDRIVVTMNNGIQLDQFWHTSVTLLFCGLAVLASVGVSLFSVARRVRHELDLAQAKSRFSAMVSHELRTPIAAIRMYGEILENDMVSDPDKIKEYHSLVAKEALRLSRLVEGILELGRLENTSKGLTLAPESLSLLVEESLAVVHAAGKGPEVSTVRTRIPPGLPLVFVDRAAAVQTIANLVDNALRYGRDAEVVARCSSDRVWIDVLDRGPGIPASQKKEIFSPYVRLQQRPRGVGLGLALVKLYLAAMGASIEVADRAGGGTVFSVALRRASEEGGRA